MNVLRLTPHFYWPQLAEKGWPIKFDAIGGMQTQIYRLTASLAEMGVRQTVLTLKIPGTPNPWQMCDQVTVHGVRIPVLPLRSRVRGMMDLNLAWALGVFRNLLQRSDGYEIIHVHCSGVFWPLLVGMIVSTRMRKKLVVTVHCSTLITYDAMSVLDPVLIPFSRWCERRVIEKADHTLVLTPRLRDFFLQSGFGSPHKISVVPDSIDVQDFRSKATTETVAYIRNRFRLPRDRPTIGYVGRIAHEKGWPYLIDLAERMQSRQVHFLVCGDGNERDKLERLIQRKNLQDRFTITGFLPQELIPAILVHIDVLVLTSLHEEFGSVLIEGMAMQIPVVAFANGGIPYVVEDGRTGLLSPVANIDEMAATIETLIDNPALARRLGDNGLSTVLSKYDLHMTSRRLYEIYQVLLN